MASRGGSLADIVPSGLSLQDLFGTAPPPTWAPPLLKFLNGQQRALQQSVQGKLGVGNFAWDYKTALFTHGVPVSLSTTRVRAPKGVFATSADGQVVTAVEAHPSSIPGQINVTLFFSDPAAKNVSAGLFILPDGVASGKQPAARPMWRQISVTDFGAKGDGNADDTLAFANALAATKGIVFVPAGDYIITGLSIPSGKQLIGEGPGVTRLRYAGDSYAITLNGCIWSRVEGFEIITTSSNAGVRGIWIQNAAGASKWNRIVDCYFVQANATARIAGQVGLLMDDNAAAVNAQFWNEVHGCVFLNWDICISLTQSGAGADGVNQSFFANNMGASFNTGVRVGPRCGDHVFVGLFGSHSSGAAFNDTLVVLGDGAANSGGSQIYGAIADMGANGRAFTINDIAAHNLIISTNESSLQDQELGAGNRGNIMVGLQQLITTAHFGAGRRAQMQGLDIEAIGSLQVAAQALFRAQVQADKKVTVADADYTILATDRTILLTPLTATRVMTFPSAAGSAGQRITIKQKSRQATGTIKVQVKCGTGGNSVEGVASPGTFDAITGAPFVASFECDGTDWNLV